MTNANEELSFDRLDQVSGGWHQRPLPPQQYELVPKADDRALLAFLSWK